ncbi:MAG: glycosyltransferase [Candidatus Nealsonbacteria bacterium]|nr:glycosyltransferase [Candidatus Nealsonbacteria bacterium]
MPPCIVVIPCYNEADRLPVDAFAGFNARGHSVRFLMVDDGSTDATQSVLQSLHRRDPQRFSVLRLPQNSGKAEAVRRGILSAMAEPVETVGFWDADLATPLEAIPEFLDTMQQNPQLQLVIGARVKLLGRHVERRPLRHYLGRVFATAASLALRLPVYDTQCGAKMFRVTQQTRRLFATPFCTNWIFDVELLARLVRLRKAAGLASPEQCVYELPLTQWRDVAGSKVRPRDFVKSFFELLRIYRRYLSRRAVWPPGEGLELTEVLADESRRAA